MGWIRAHAVLLAASLLVGGGFVWLLEAGALPVVPPSAAWGSVRPWTAVAFTLLFLGVHLLRCTRWALLVPEQYRPKLSLTLSIGLIGYGAQVLMPFRLGEAARPALIHSHTRLPLGTAAGVVGAERIVDGLVLSLVLVISLLSSTRLSPLPDHIGELPIPAAIIPTLAWSGVVGFGVLSLVMAAMYFYQAPVRRMIELVLSPVSPRLARWAERTTGSVVGGFAFLRELDTTPVFALLTLLYWAGSVAAFWLLLWGAGVPSPSWVQAGVVLGVLGLGLAVPNAPGYFGTFQISGYSALVLFYPLPVVMSAGAAFLFLLYVIQMALTLVAAGMALPWMSRLTRSSRTSRASLSSPSIERGSSSESARAPARSPEAK
ncbi:MAG TPA: lysylphosphatidylglycerol synthase transmembrane domain-containing protein [Polyangiaceae bacterium]|nr:lysylphosphatidylglycerol synthase transmembrane domain-containing protein [Polyangiaceae bacterium]